jgi:hypothetical protein
VVVRKIFSLEEVGLILDPTPLNRSDPSRPSNVNLNYTKTVNPDNSITIKATGKVTIRDLSDFTCSTNPGDCLMVAAVSVICNPPTTGPYAPPRPPVCFPKNYELEIEWPIEFEITLNPIGQANNVMSIVLDSSNRPLARGWPVSYGMLPPQIGCLR